MDTPLGASERISFDGFGGDAFDDSTDHQVRRLPAERFAVVVHSVLRNDVAQLLELELSQPLPQTLFTKFGVDSVGIPRPGCAAASPVPDFRRRSLGYRWYRCDCRVSQNSFALSGFHQNDTQSSSEDRVLDGFFGDHPKHTRQDTGEFSVRGCQLLQLVRHTDLPWLGNRTTQRHS